MSNVKTQPSRPRVIVRAFGDEPVILTAHRLDSQLNRVFVGVPDATNPLSLPIEDVFDYDQGLFTKLTKAFDERNSAALTQIYNNARGKKPCNKYQDTLKSGHEK